MKGNNNIKAVVMGGSWNRKYKNDVLTIYLGAYENIMEAYGEALIYLNEMAADYSEQKSTITPLYDLEADQGFGMELNIDGEDLVYYANIFINYDCPSNQRKEKGDDANDSTYK